MACSIITLCSDPAHYTCWAARKHHGDTARCPRAPCWPVSYPPLSCERNERHMPWRTRPLQSKRQLKNSLISRTSGNHANCTIASILSWFTSCLIEGVEEWHERHSSTHLLRGAASGMRRQLFSDRDYTTKSCRREATGTIGKRAPVSGRLARR